MPKVDPEDWCALNRLLDDFADEERCREYLIDAFSEFHKVSRTKVAAVLNAWEKFEPLTPTLH
jgi:hypothetical protein